VPEILTVVGKRGTSLLCVDGLARYRVPGKYVEKILPPAEIPAPAAANG
jgi:hypothetical protein